MSYSPLQILQYNFLKTPVAALYFISFGLEIKISSLFFFYQFVLIKKVLESVKGSDIVYYMSVDHTSRSLFTTGYILELSE